MMPVSHAAEPPDDVARRIELALRMIELGASVFPLAPGSKAPLIPKRKGGGGFLDASPDPAAARTFLAHAGHPNYGVAFPEGSDVIVLDLDGGDREKRPEWKDDWQRLYERLGPPGLTYLVRTPSGGRHAYYRWRTDLYGPIPPGDELLGWTVRKPWKGYLVGPGSVVDGRVYEPAGLDTISDLAEPWVRAAIAEKARRAASGTITVGGTPPASAIVVGHRHAYLRDRARHLVGVGLTGEALFAAVMDLNRQLAEPKTEDEVRRAIGDAETKFERDAVDPAYEPAAPRPAEEISASSIDAADLLELDIPPLSWIVPDLLPEGTTVLAGPPKLGKSCLVYQVAVEVALGGELLGRAIEQGDVLYLALEDGKRRGQTRLRAALGSRGMPRGRLEVRWAAAKLGEGLEQELVDWLEAHPRARLVAIDTLQRVRARGDARRNAYEIDVEDLARLQDIFKDRAVGLLIVHHSKKDAGDDFLASVSGTYGITGSADTTLVIQRKRLETFGKLVVTGRDVQEVEEPVQFNGLTWSQAPRSLAEASFEQAEVYKVIEAEGPIFPKAIADRIGSTRDAVQKLVEKLVAGGSVARAGGGYVAVAVRLVEDAEGVDEAETGASAHSAHSPSRARAGTHAGVTTHSTHSPHLEGVGEGAEGAGTRVSRPRAREADAPIVTVDAGESQPVRCHWYADHQHQHFRAADGWRCSICSPIDEETP